MSLVSVWPIGMWISTLSKKVKIHVRSFPSGKFLFEFGGDVNKYERAEQARRDKLTRSAAGRPRCPNHPRWYQADCELCREAERLEYRFDVILTYPFRSQWTTERDLTQFLVAMSHERALEIERAIEKEPAEMRAFYIRNGGRFFE